MSVYIRFSSFFLKMGFAGQVELYTGQNENDFDNYGIKILVKYRDHEVLQVTNNQFIYDTAYKW